MMRFKIFIGFEFFRQFSFVCFLCDDPFLTCFKKLLYEVFNQEKILRYFLHFTI